MTSGETPNSAADEPCPIDDFYRAVFNHDQEQLTVVLLRIRTVIFPLLNRLNPALDPDDVACSAQRTILRRLLENSESVRQPSWPRFWEKVIAIAKKKADKRRRRKRPFPLPNSTNELGEVRQLDPADHREHSPAEAALLRLLGERLEAFLESLPEPNRTLFHMRWYEGKKPAEIAAEMSAQGVRLTPSAISERIRRIERDLFAQEGGGDDPT